MTTTKFYPAHDICLRRSVSNETWAQIAVTGDGTDSENSSDPWLAVLTGDTSPLFDQLDRFFFAFNTATLGSGATVTGARFGFTANSKGNDLGDVDLALTKATPANPISMVPNDYDSVLGSSLGTIAYGDITADNATYNEITLNSTGLAAINKSGYTVLVLRFAWDVVATFGGAWDGPWANSHVAINMSEIAGTDKDPYLEIDYTAGEPSYPFTIDAEQVGSNIIVEWL